MNNKERYTKMLEHISDNINEIEQDITTLGFAIARRITKEIKDNKELDPNYYEDILSDIRKVVFNAHKKIINDK